VAFLALVFARGVFFIEEDTLIVLANFESLLEFYTHSSLHRERETEIERERERKGEEERDREREKEKKREIEGAPDDERRKVVVGSQSEATQTVRDDYL
jgi:hypothetical protein